MATQSSLMEQQDANLLVKTKLELTCSQKTMWLNQTNGQLVPGQQFDVRIISVIPVPLDANINTETIKSGRLQMAALFASLENISDTADTANRPSEPHRNLKVGAVNKFFAEFAKSFSELIAQLFQKLIKFFENLVHRKKVHNTSIRTSGITWKCNTNNNNKNDSSIRRQKRQSFKSINFSQFEREINSLFELPFSFLQLEDGSVVNVQLSPSEKNLNVMHFKRFIAQSFATQLDESKKTVLEKSTLGEHNSHYQMEYDELDKTKVTPEQYMSSVTNRRRIRRSSSFSKSFKEMHIVSVVRTIKRADMINPHNNPEKENERNLYQHKALQLADIEFDAQQVQLIEANMLVASGGYFHSVLPNHHYNNNNRFKRGTRSSSQKINNATIVSANDNEQAHFDQVLKNYFTMNLEYSLVVSGVKLFYCNY